MIKWIRYNYLIIIFHKIFVYIYILIYSRLLFDIIIQHKKLLSVAVPDFIKNVNLGSNFRQMDACSWELISFSFMNKSFLYWKRWIKLLICWISSKKFLRRNKNVLCPLKDKLITILSLTTDFVFQLRLYYVININFDSAF